MATEVKANLIIAIIFVCLAMLMALVSPIRFYVLLGSTAVYFMKLFSSFVKQRQ